MADTFQLQVATPERLFVDEQVNEAELPGESGYMGVLPGHAPLLSALGAGLLTYNGNGGTHRLVIDGGFVEVFEDHVRVLADNAEHPEDIQADTEQKALNEANERLKSAQEPGETEAALRAMRRAQARLDAAQNSRQ